MKRYRIALNQKEDTHEILIHGPIGKSFWSDEGISGKEFTDALDEIPEGSKITIGVNSQGGSVGDGLAIFNAIGRRASDVTVRIDGYALSVASFFPLAASRVVSPKTSVWMIHNAWSWCEGDADEMRKNAEMLDKHDDVLVQGYAKRTGKKDAEIRKSMQEETWFTGEEAVAYGLADESTDTEPDLEALDLSAAKAAFKHVPDYLAPIFAAAASPRRPAEKTTTVPIWASDKPPKNTKTKTMNKEKIIALLKSRGVVVADDATEEQLIELLEKSMQQPKAEGEGNQAPDPELTAVLVEIKNLLAERKQDEEDKRKAREAPPLKTRGSAETVGDADDRLILMPAGLERRRFLTNAWNDIRKARERKTPQASNTIAAALTTDMLSQTVITNLQNRLAPILAFFTDAQIDPVKPMATIQVPNVTTGATAQTDPTDWESGNSIVAAIAITMHEYSVSFHCTNAELQSGSRIATLSNINATQFANKIIDVLAALFTAAYTNDAVVSSPAAFGSSERAALWASAKNFTIRNLVVDGSYWARMLPVTQENFSISQGAPAYGFDGVWYMNRWSAAASGVYGFVASPEAAVCATGLPIEPPGSSSAFSSLNAQQIPELGITVQTSSWLKAGTRVQWQAYDMMFGCNRGDVTALTLLKSS